MDEGRSYLRIYLSDPKRVLPLWSDYIRVNSNVDSSLLFSPALDSLDVHPHMSHIRLAPHHQVVGSANHVPDLVLVPGFMPR